jgi:hypothetical protein
MKLFNLTDIETPALKRLGWVSMPIVVGHALIEPGGELEVGDTALIRRDIHCYTGPGALAVDARPPAYMVAKAALENKARLAAMEAKALEKRKGKK